MAFLDESTWRGKIYSGGWKQAAGGDAPLSSPRPAPSWAGPASPHPPTSPPRPRPPPPPSPPGPPFPIPNGPRSCAAPVTSGGRTPPRSSSGTSARAARSPARSSSRPTSPRRRSSRRRRCRPGPTGSCCPASSRNLSFVERVPVGVVGVIAPVQLPADPGHPLGRARAGARQRGACSSPTRAPRSAAGSSSPGCSRRRGCRRGCCTCCRAAPDVGEALVADPLVRVISFTGSTAAGRRVGQLAAAHLKRCHLELGGNSALIVMDDADLDRAASAGAWGSFLHQGQICMTTGRHLVHEAVYDDYVARLAGKAEHLPVGNPATEPGGARPDHRRAPARQGPRAGHRERRRGRPAGRRRHLRGAVLPAHRAGRRRPRDARLRERGVRPGRAGDPVRDRRRGGQARRRTPSTGCPWASSPGT